MCKLILLVALASIIGSCMPGISGKGGIESAVGHKIRESCLPNQPCSLRIAEVASFQWDKMIVFSGGLTYVDINKVLGKVYFTDRKFGLSATFVFLKDDEIVYTEENIRDIEGYRQGDTYFSDVDPLQRYRSYPKNGVFEVQRMTLTNGEYYSLRCINCDEITLAR